MTLKLIPRYAQFHRGFVMRHKNLYISLGITIACASPTFAEAVTVKRGDTLSKIAAQTLGAADRWPELCEANKATIRNCNSLPIGVQVTIPAGAVVKDAVASTEEAEPNTGDDAPIVVKLKCSDLPGAPGFSRDIAFTREVAGLSYSTGVAGQMNYEKWVGAISDDGSLEITGEYIQGGPDLKSIKFDGTADGADLEASGTRGPRSCTIASVSP